MSDSGPASLVWLSSPPSLALIRNEVHVWLVRAQDSGLYLACCENLLSAAERARAAKFKFEKDRQLYTAAHAGLRSILAGYLNVAAGGLEFETGRRGKPRLASTFAKDGLEFNLSHSHEVALIAVACEREVGVDVERVREDFAFAELAERHFTASEVSALRALPVGLQRRAFYQCWTSKEALLKAKGGGLSGELDEVEILFDGEGLVQVTSTIPGWHLSELNPCDGYAGAIALEGSKGDLRCFQCADPAQATSHCHS